jgi:hypothetical protein
VKLEELKANLAEEFEGVPNMVIPEFMKTQSFDEMKARLAKMPKIPLPDFASRKATLKEMKAKLEEISKTASTMDKPDKAFYEEVKKTLKESMDPKVGRLELPELTEAEKAVLAGKKTATLTADVAPNRFVEDFGDEVYSNHLEAASLQKSLFASTGMARRYMVDQVYDVFAPMTFDLGELKRLNTENTKKIKSSPFSPRYHGNDANEKRSPRPHRLGGIGWSGRRLCRVAKVHLCQRQLLLWP